VVSGPPFVPVIATSRRVLPLAGFAGPRRPFPFEVLEMPVADLSLVLEASDFESSGAGLDLGGAILDGWTAVSLANISWVSC